MIPFSFEKFMITCSVTLIIKNKIFHFGQLHIDLLGKRCCLDFNPKHRIQHTRNFLIRQRCIDKIFRGGNLRRIKQLLHLPFYVSHISHRSYRHQFDLGLAFPAQGDQRNGFLIIHFTKRIFERRSGITDSWG